MTATALASGNAAYADIMYFSNEDLNFTWNLDTNLDITKAWHQQGSAENRSSFFQYYYYGAYPYVYLVGRTSPSRFANTGTWGILSFAPGDLIGPSTSFSNSTPVGAYYYWSDWDVYIGDGAREYVGLRFEDAGGDMHYGWMDVMWNPGDERFDAYAWAYETEADKPIGAAEGIPEPGTLAMFAVGAMALAAARARRRRKKAEA